MRSITAAWNGIQNWFDQHAPGAFTPRPPATQAQIDAAEKAYGVALPDDYKASLLVHDGIEQNDDLDWFLASWIAPIDDCVAAWKDQREYDEEDPDLDGGDEDAFHGVLNHPRRIPVIGTPYWDYSIVYLDMIPGPAGREGQLVALVDECDFERVAGSFGAFLDRFAELLDANEMKIYQDDMVRLVTRADERTLGDLFIASPPGV